MSTIRSPRKATAHCPVAGCGWVKTYFDLHTRRKLGKIILNEIWPAGVRAELGKRAHIARVHSKRPPFSRVTRILGR